MFTKGIDLRRDSLEEQTLYLYHHSKSAVDEGAFQGIQLDLYTLKVCLQT